MPSNGAVCRALVVSLAFAAGALAPPLAGQQLGPLYKDEARGFALKPPKDWDPIPTPPTERWVLVRFQDRIQVTGRTAFVGHNSTIDVIYFDKEAAAVEGLPEQFNFKDYDSYLKGQVRKFTVDSRKESKVSGIPATLYEVTQDSDVRLPLKRYCIVYHGEHADVAVEAQVLAEQWDKFKKEVGKSIRTFQFIERAVPAGTDDLPQDASEQDRFLQEQIDKLPPGWYHHWSPRKRYLFLSDAEKPFTVELSRHIEAIRDVYEQLYPPDRPIEAVSIVRVCKNRDEYIGYGGAGSSAGYWNWVARELVFYDAKSRNRADSFAVLYHEAFHQYIYYFYGEVSPASWYNEGHGDYFSGAVFRGTSIQKIEPFDWRVPVIKEAVRTGKYKPLKEIMGYSQREYYAEASLCYAQGWSIVWFLRQGRLQPKWEAILPDYLNHLVAAFDAAKQTNGGDSRRIDEHAVQQQAYEATFKDWTDDDWAAFEAAWLKFIS